MEKKIKCYKCGKMFKDVNYKSKYKSAMRIYCDECVKEIWDKQKLKLFQKEDGDYAKHSFVKN